MINDFGEKIGGARKDLWKERGLMVEDLDGMTQGESLHRELIPLCQSDRDKILQQKYKGTVRQALLQCHMDRQKRFRSSHQGWRADDHQF